MRDDFNTRMQQLIDSNRILLFVKGSKEQPMCGFSAKVIDIFKGLGRPFETVNILANEEIRQGMKDFSNWPTFPQIYINGEFVGGCDILMEMVQAGELQKLVEGVPNES